MSLSMDEQRLLGEIEQRLATEDPRLATVFSRFAAAHHRRSPLPRTRPAALSSGERPGSSHRRPSATARPGLRRRALPWLALVSGTAMLAAGVVLGQVVLALSGSVVLAATPLLFPTCAAAPLGEHLTGQRLMSRRAWLGWPFRRS